MATAADGNPRSRRDLGRSLRDAVVHHVPAVRGVRANMLGPTPFLDGFRPRIAREHGRALYLVERVVGGSLSITIVLRSPPIIIVTGSLLKRATAMTPG